VFTLLAIGVAVVLGGGALMVLADRLSGSERRKPVTKVALADGSKQVRVNGKVLAKSTLVAPYSQRACVYYKICVSIDATEVGFPDVERACDFDVRDDSGTAHVLAERAKFDVVADIFEIGRAADLTYRAQSLLEELGFEVPARVANIEIREGVLIAGDTVDIVGQPVCEPSKEITGDERGYRELRMVPVFSNALVLGEVREPRFVGHKN
jgi:hypothetical protein